MKTTLINLVYLIIGAFFGIAIFGSIQAHTRSHQISTVDPLAETHDVQIEYVYVPAEPEVITEYVTEYVYVPFEQPFYLNLTEEEISLLEQIAYAEARGEGVKGMALVMNVVLNRASEWNMSIRDVIFAEGQFYTEGMTKDVSYECYEAAQLVIEGYDESQGALFFNKYGYPEGREPLFQYKSHYFSK